MVKRTTAALVAVSLVAMSASAAMAASAPGGRGATAPTAPTGADAEVLTGMSVAQAEAFITEAGATVTDRLEGEEGFSLNFQYANGYYAYVEGFDCVGQGLSAVCSEIEIGAVYTADDADHARRMEVELDFVWIADVAVPEDSELLVWRRDCLHYGVTRAQAAHWFVTMEEQLALIGQVMWPHDGTARESGTVET